MTKHVKVRAVDPNEFKVHWNKAEEFYDTMQHAYKNRMWTAVGLNAVHCVISSCDALLVKSQGIRAAGAEHVQMVDILARSPIEGIETQTATVRRIIAKKNAIAYDDREFRESEAADLLKQAESFYRWAFEYLNKK